MKKTKEFDLTIGDFENIKWENLCKESGKHTIQDYKIIFGEKIKALKLESENEKEIEVYDFLSFLINFRFSPSETQNPFPAYLIGRPSVIDLITLDHISLLENLLKKTQLPEIQAIFNDLIWVKAKKITHARAAIAAYIASAQNLANNPKELMEASWRFERALRLSSQIKEHNKLKEIPPLILEAVQKNALTTDNFTCIYLMELLIKTKHIEGLCSIATSAAEHSKDKKLYRLESRYWEIVSDCHHLSKDSSEKENAKLKIAEAFVNNALNKVTLPNHGYLAACYYFEKAIEAFKKVNFKSEDKKESLRVRKEAIHKLYRNSQKSARSESKSFTIPLPEIPDQVAEAIESLKDLSFKDALINLAYMHSFISKKDALRKVEKNQPSIYSLLANKSTIDSEGLILRKSKSGEESLNEALLSSLKPLRVILSQHINLACIRITLDHYSNARSWDWLVRYNPVIPSGHEEIFALAFEHGLKGNYLVFANLILPQIENSLRHLLESNDTITSTLPPSGIQQVKTLETILKEPRLIDIIGEDLHFELSMLLAKEGLNIRNRSCHGTLKTHEFYSEDIIYLWYLMLRFCCFPIIRTLTNSSSEKKNSAQE